MTDTTMLEHTKNLYEYMHLGHMPTVCDIMLVFGSIDLDVARYAAELFLAGYSRSGKIIVSWGVAHTGDLLATGWQDSEADMFAREMIAAGMPDAAIIRENRATNSGENVRFSADIITRDYASARTFLVVHKPYMERRALATWEAQYPLPYELVRIVSRPETLDEHIARTTLDETRFLNILVGDVERMERYATLGYQSDQWPLPRSVRESMDKLVSLGYTQHLSK